MKKTILALFTVLSISAAALCARQFIEGTDYQSDFKENTDDMPAVLHINFTNITPTPDEAEKLIKDQLKIYAKIIETEADAKKKIEAQNAPVSKSKAAASAKPAKKNTPQDKAKDAGDDDQSYKNIIGSVWYNVAPQQTQTEETPAARSETPVVAIQPSVPVVSLSSGVAVSTGTDAAVKVKFKDNLSAYVYLGKTKKIVPFPDYVNFLKKERDAKKAKDKADAAAQTAQDGLQTDQTADQPAADAETKN